MLRNFPLFLLLFALAELPSPTRFSPVLRALSSPISWAPTPFSLLLNTEISCQVLLVAFAANLASPADVLLARHEISLGQERVTNC